MAAVEFNRYDKALIADIIHDRFVDLESVDWDKAENILEIPYFNESDLKTPEGKIRFHNVLAVNITDAEKVRYYDLNFIKWDEKNNIISLFTGIPLVFEIWVTNFKIMIVRPDECGPEFSATRPADSILATGTSAPPPRPGATGLRQKNICPINNRVYIKPDEDLGNAEQDKRRIARTAVRKMPDVIKERIRNLVFYGIGGIGTIVSFIALQIHIAELRAARHNASARYSSEKIGYHAEDVLFAGVILSLFLIILLSPRLRQRSKNAESITLFFAGLLGAMCFMKNSFLLTEVICLNLKDDPELNIISTYWIAILSTAIPLLFFLVLFVFNSIKSTSLIKAYLRSCSGKFK